VSAVWQCGRCFALHFGGERVCRRCGALRPSPSRPVILPRAPDSEAIHLALPPTDFPYSRRAGTRERRRYAPLVFFAFAAVLTLAWDPVARRVAAGRALGGESVVALDARRGHLAIATRELGALLDARDAPGADRATWRADVRALGPRWHLAGDPGSPTLGPLEVRVRAAWLAVASLPDDAAPGGPHVSLAREQISRATEDLSHAP
jgi:hypothetical protein